MEEEKISTKKAPLFCSTRFSLAIIGFFGFVNLYALRVNMSVAIVCMVNQTALDDEDGPEGNDSWGTTAPDDECYLDDTVASGTEGPFLWDKETQGLILGAFFWGYLLTQIPGGWLAETFGAKHVFGWSMAMAGVATLLTPVGANYSPYLLIVLRVVKGIGEGVVFPATHALWSRWAPPLERSKLIGFTYAGAQIGNVITFPVSGVLCDGVGWESIFYVFGTLGMLWFIGWLIIVSDSPASHRRISAEEREYIESSLGASREHEMVIRKEKGTPWLSIFRSMPVWAIVVAHTFSNWGTYTLLTNIPTYMMEVLKFDIKTNGFLSAIPYILFWLMINVGGWVADTLRTRGWDTKLVRKIMQGLGMFLPGLFLIITGYIPCTIPYVAVAVLSIAVGCCGLQYAGAMVNHVDIAPPFAGILFGVSNTAATIPGIVAPYIVGVITSDQTASQWRIVFYISAAIYLVGAVFYLIFAEGEIQDWAKPYISDKPLVSEVIKVPLEMTHDSMGDTMAKPSDTKEGPVVSQFPDNIWTITKL